MNDATRLRDGEPPRRRVEATLGWLGRSLNDTSWRQFVQLVDWLRTEAERAGGIGPNEGSRVWDRHVIDSLVFGIGLGTNGDVLDIGTGAGLPVLPLAIAYPDRGFLALDRSRRRVDLVDRAVRIIGLDNVDTVCCDVGELSELHQSITARAVTDPQSIASWMPRLLVRGGVAMVGGHRSAAASELPVSDLLDIEEMRVPERFLDSPATLLKMVRRVDPKQ